MFSFFKKNKTTPALADESKATDQTRLIAVISAAIANYDRQRGVRFSTPDPGFIVRRIRRI